MRANYFLWMEKKTATLPSPEKKEQEKSRTRMEENGDEKQNELIPHGIVFDGPFYIHPVCANDGGGDGDGGIFFLSLCFRFSFYYIAFIYLFIVVVVFIFFTLHTQHASVLRQPMHSVCSLAVFVRFINFSVFVLLLISLLMLPLLNRCYIFCFAWPTAGVFLLTEHAAHYTFCKFLLSFSLRLCFYYLRVHCIE